MSITRTAPAPTRATNTVTLSAATLNIVLSVYTAVETTAVVRQEFYNGNPDISVGRAPIRRDTDEVIHQSDITRMAQADDGTWVVLGDDEVSEVAGPSGGCEVVTFVPVKDAGQYLIDGLYQVRPKIDKRGGGAMTAAFNLLLAGMTARKVHALVKVTMRGAPRYALLTATGDLLMVVPSDGIRQALPMPDGKPSKAEIAVAGQLIDAIGVGAPVVIDDNAPLVRAYVNNKAKANPAPLVRQPAAVVDVTALLQQSIAAAKADRRLAQGRKGS